MKKRRKVAVLVASSIYNQKGLFNAVHNRCLHLVKVADYDVDVYLLSSYKDYLVSILSGRKVLKRPSIYDKDNITYHILWRRNSIIDYILFHKFHRREILHNLYNRKIVPVFKDYDLLDIHSGCGTVALEVKKRYGIPYVASWHGSDIHTVPKYNASAKKDTAKVIKSANCNFFVSEALATEALNITSDIRYKVLYNGTSSMFKVYPNEQRQELRQRFGVYGKKVVVFAGNIIPVKNPLVLPDIFRQVKSSYGDNVVFWIIGDGELRMPLESKMREQNIDAIFFGNVESEEMPVLFQCANVVILCSLNEGFGLTLLEALKCGANAVASRVGGTLELLGEENTFTLDNNFIYNISQRIVYLLNNDVKQSVDSKFSWEFTAKIENETINQILRESK